MTEGLFSLKGRVALVTGGSRGIGKMIAAGYVSQGAKVYISSRKSGPCNDTAAELSAYGGTCISMPQDLSTVEGCRTLAARLEELEPKLDILVNNAGAAWGRLSMISPKRLGQGDELKPQIALLLDPGRASTPARGGPP